MFFVVILFLIASSNALLARMLSSIHRRFPEPWMVGEDEALLGWQFWNTNSWIRNLYGSFEALERRGWYGLLGLALESSLKRVLRCFSFFGNWYGKDSHCAHLLCQYGIHSPRAIFCYEIWRMSCMGGQEDILIVPLMNSSSKNTKFSLCVYLTQYKTWFIFTFSPQSAWSSVYRYITFFFFFDIPRCSGINHGIIWINHNIIPQIQGI